MLNAKKALLLVALAVLVSAPGALAQASRGTPKISARPHQVMLGARTTLKGRGFPAKTTLQIRECGFTFWLAPKDPCVEGNGVTVTTNAKGKFETRFQVGLCPEGESTKRPTQRICYVGAIETGEDTGSLVGAARLVVTYP